MEKSINDQTNEQKVAIFHDKVAHIFDSAFFSSDTPKDMTADFEFVAKTIREVADNRRNGICVDLGSGNGHFSNIASDRMFTIAIDISRSMSREANSARAKNKLVCQSIMGSILQVPLKSSCSDIVQCTWVIEFLLNREDLINLFTNAKKLLKKDGILLVADSLVGPHGETTQGLYKSKETWMEKYNLSAIDLTRYLWRPNAIEQIILDLSFEILSYEEGKLCWVMVCKNGEN